METEIMIEEIEVNEEASITKVMETEEAMDQEEETTRDQIREVAVAVEAEATKREEDTIKEEEVPAQAADDQLNIII
jgi:hypothetical protein